MGSVISFTSLAKVFQQGHSQRVILDGVSGTIPYGAHVALLGAQGSGKTTILKMLSNLERPTRGTIKRNGAVSFMAGSIQPGQNFSVRQYLGFVARVYGVDIDSFIDFVSTILGRHIRLDTRVSALPAEAKLRMNFASLYAIRFDFYLFDNHPILGPREFKEQCLPLFERRAAESGFLLATGSAQIARAFCRSGIVLHDGKLTGFSDIHDAISFAEDCAALPDPSRLRRNGAVELPDGEMVYVDDDLVTSRKLPDALRLAGAPALALPGAGSPMADVDTLVSELQRAIRQRTWGVARVRGKMLVAEGAQERALAVCLDAIEADSDAKAAEQVFGIGLSVSPKDYLLRLRYGKFLIQQSRFAEARSAFERCVSLSSHNYEARYLVAKEMVRSDDVAAALTELESLIGVRPSYLVAHLYYIQVLLDTNDPRATAVLAAFREKHPHDKRLKSLLERVRDGAAE